MEPPQPRAYGTEGRKTTHDFLSLYSSLQQDPRTPQGGFLRTHDFLQPLEGEGKSVGKEEIEVEMTNVEKPLPPAMEEHVLPGDTGTNSISYLHQRPPKPEEGSFFTVSHASITDTNDENSDYTSGTRSGFTVWNESTLKKGMTMTNKDNFAGERAVLRGNLSVKVDEKSSDQKPNTPRSKHSATEQRRRSKINERFQMLRGIIPHSDQKRDKASFLSEVIEHIQFLQEKVHKYEGSSYQGSWDNETSRLPWGKCHSGAQGYTDHSQCKNNVSTPALMLAKTRPGISLAIPISEQNIESNINLACPKENDDQSEKNEKPASLPMHPINAFPFCGTSNTMAGRDTSTSRHQSQCSSDRSHITSHAVGSDKSKEEDLMTIESGTISISTMYSQGLLNTLTKALQNSGVDLSQASISVHVDLGKRSNGRLNSSTSTLRGDDISTSNQPIPHSITSTSQDECDQGQKRLKTSRG